MSFYTAESRCPRCRALLPQRVPACPNCGLALADASAPRASRSGPPPSWQANDIEGYGASSPGRAFDVPRGSGPEMYRPGGQFAPRASGPFGGSAPASFRQPEPDYEQRPEAFDQPGPGYQQRSGAFGPGGRFIDAGDASTSYQRPQS